MSVGVRVCSCGRILLGSKAPVRCDDCRGETAAAARRQSDGKVSDTSWVRGYASAMAEVLRNVVPVRLDVVRDAVAAAAKGDGVTLAMMRAAGVTRTDLVRLRGVIPEGE